jgi:lipopolysaccharide transport system permease protein
MPPAFQMIIFTVIFGRWANMGTASVNGRPLHYPVWVYAALLPWTYISNAFTVAGLSLLNQQHMLTKIYFPRLFVPFAVIVGGMVDMLISLVVFGALMAFYQVLPSWQIIFLPLLLLATIATSAGISLILAAVTLTYRDFRYVIPFLVQAMMYLSAVVFPMSKVPENWQPIAAINPIFGLIDAYRTILLGTPWHPTILAISLAVTAGLLTLGLYYFKRTERRFADIA